MPEPGGGDPVGIPRGGLRRVFGQKHRPAGIGHQGAKHPRRVLVGIGEPEANSPGAPESQGLAF